MSASTVNQQPGIRFIDNPYTQAKTPGESGRPTFDANHGFTGHMWFAVLSARDKDGEFPVNHIFGSEDDFKAWQLKRKLKTANIVKKTFTKLPHAIKWILTTPVEIKAEERSEAVENAFIYGFGEEGHLKGRPCAVELSTGLAADTAFFSESVTIDPPGELTGEKCYALHKAGGVVLNHIFLSWKECMEYTRDRVSVLKSFASIEQAKWFLEHIDAKWVRKCELAQEKEKK